MHVSHQHIHVYMAQYNTLITLLCTLRYVLLRSSCYCTLHHTTFATLPSVITLGCPTLHNSALRYSALSYTAVHYPTL